MKKERVVGLGIVLILFLFTTFLMTGCQTAPPKPRILPDKTVCLELGMSVTDVRNIYATISYDGFAQTQFNRYRYYLAPNSRRLTFKNDELYKITRGK